MFWRPASDSETLHCLHVVKGQVAQRWKPCPCTSCLTYLSNQFKVKGDRETRAISPVLIEVERWLNSGLPGQNDAVTDELTDWFVCSATEHRCFNYYWQTISNKVQYNWQCSSSPCATEKFLNILKQLPRTFVILVIYISISVCLQSLGTKITGLNDWSFGNIRTTALYFTVYVYIKIKDVQYYRPDISILCNICNNYHHFFPPIMKSQ